MDAEIKSDFSGIRADLHRLETTPRQDIRDDGIATRRHIDIVAESLRGNLRIIAKGLIALDAKVETMR